MSINNAVTINIQEKDLQRQHQKYKRYYKEKDSIFLDLQSIYKQRKEYSA